MVIISDDVRTRELLPDVVPEKDEGGPVNALGPSFRMAALREMHGDGRLIVRPLDALSANQAIWKHFTRRESPVGHSLMAVHYFDRELVKGPPPLELSVVQKEAVRQEARENGSECNANPVHPYHRYSVFAGAHETSLPVAEGVKVSPAGMLRVKFYKRVDEIQWQHSLLL